MKKSKDIPAHNMALCSQKLAPVGGKCLIVVSEANGKFMLSAHKAMPMDEFIEELLSTTLSLMHEHRYHQPSLASTYTAIRKAIEENARHTSIPRDPATIYEMIIENLRQYTDLSREEVIEKLKFIRKDDPPSEDPFALPDYIKPANT